jgi:tetratricopeptide (TPR) repeat protein
MLMHTIRSLDEQVQLPPGIFEFVDPYFLDVNRFKESEYFELISYLRLFEEGDHHYNSTNFKEALNCFEKALNVQPRNEVALLGKALALFGVQAKQDFSVHQAFLRTLAYIKQSSTAYPQDWDNAINGQLIETLKNVYIYCENQLYAKNAFEELLELLNVFDMFLGDQVMFLDLKFKCLWELNKPTQMKWECGELLKAHYATKENFKTLILLSPKMTQRVEDTISRHLSFNSLDTCAQN